MGKNIDMLQFKAYLILFPNYNYHNGLLIDIENII